MPPTAVPAIAAVLMIGTDLSWSTRAEEAGLYGVTKVVMWEAEEDPSSRTVGLPLSAVVVVSAANCVDIEVEGSVDTAELTATGSSTKVTVDAVDEELGVGGVTKDIVRCVTVLVAC